ncbi:MAG: shikimate dehydrogenase [Prevotellaceae bacterium]|nr:shikimate dehydrogenase [Prevotella sp.]MDD7257256.1 shikimate dehydrogenase [Prevotellaceae bacterium]MDY6130326.1 shikimate dehydrogenase [Prevotella sp.]
MDKYGLIGCPLGHSFSISYFNEKFQNENIDAEYVNFEIPKIEDLPEILATNPELKGLNVTIPYKQQVIGYLDAISPEARTIGAVNVIRIEHKGRNTRLKGFNSDVIGFTKSIEPLLERHHRKALILGMGGAAKAVDYGLKSLGLETLYVGREKGNGNGHILYRDITPDMVREYNVIVNCTPCGMYPKCEECPTLPYEALDEHNLLYDLLYNPDETLFMTRGKERGATVKNGLEMLLLQAFANWDIWNGKDL